MSAFFQKFGSNISDITLPEKFTFPFYYSPHPLALLACTELQEQLSRHNFAHNFGMDGDPGGLKIGKMFGVLVVQDPKGNLGYLQAFSGKLAEANHHDGFVPPVFDMLQQDSFFKKEETLLNAYNRKIEFLEAQEIYLKAHKNMLEAQAISDAEIAEHKALMRAKKKERKALRAKAEEDLAPELVNDFIDQLTQESLSDNYNSKDLNRKWKKDLEEVQAEFKTLDLEIKTLKEERKAKSAAVQQQLFDSYFFYDAHQNKKSLWDIFKDTLEHKPPAGAGECAAPKLLQYAYNNNLKPVCLAEFWWGASPNSEVRQHLQYYPACRGKCEPILGHMLQGLDVEENPMLVNPAEGKVLETVYEDEHILIINKPEEFLSVPGKSITDSVYTRIRKKYPNATGPLVVHRLDMSTSGLMVIAKRLEIHKLVQRQFIKRTIKKRYVALLEGELKESSGTIDLPLRVDLEDRPRQLVCYKHGKSARTEWEVVGVENGKTRIHFRPITGRTHQLRVHAAHQKGLACPIIGDDLYGTKADRLHLHAAFIQFEHPVTKEQISFEVEPSF